MDWWRPAPARLARIGALNFARGAGSPSLPLSPLPASQTRMAHPLVSLLHRPWILASLHSGVIQVRILGEVLRVFCLQQRPHMLPVSLPSLHAETAGHVAVGCGCGQDGGTRGRATAAARVLQKKKNARIETSARRRAMRPRCQGPDEGTGAAQPAHVCLSCARGGGAVEAAISADASPPRLTHPHHHPPALGLPHGHPHRPLRRARRPRARR